MSEVNLTEESKQSLQQSQQYTVDLAHYIQAYQHTKLSPPARMGNPGPLGLSACAITTFTISVFNVGLFIDPRLEGLVLPLAIFYGGLAQFIAGLFEYRVPNTFGATAFCSYGAFWMSYAAYVKYFVPILPLETAHHATGLFLLTWMVFTIFMTSAAFKISRALFVVFLNLSITYIFLTAGAFAQSPTLTHAGGWFGILTALFAWYCCFALIFNSAWGKEYIPLGVHPAGAAPN